ncbi:MAG: T9SS type A sorting domain-containing protein [Paludibacteraceae bacterium]|nr:T9SS type A sorting domain-containing protein [Bacteroidales bacterium]MBR6658503.1 T9SS type A sorting domain-containing protein [Paludibacteraceae bacterium]
MKQIYTFILLFALAVTSNFTLLAQEMGQQDVEINSTNKDLSITIGVYNNILYILNAKENEKVDIMNMLGENVLSYLIKSQEERIQLDLKKGFYVVKVNDKVQRIVIK